jgi:hypothetical protein
VEQITIILSGRKRDNAISIRGILPKQKEKRNRAELGNQERKILPARVLARARQGRATDDPNGSFELYTWQDPRTQSQTRTVINVTQSQTRTVINDTRFRHKAKARM